MRKRSFSPAFAACGWKVAPQTLSKSVDMQSEAFTVGPPGV
jgi:hypothetical protein